MSIQFTLRGDHIQLDHLLKATGLAHSGGAAHLLVEQGLVAVDGKIESRKRAKLRAGQKVSCEGTLVTVVAEGQTAMES
ncbi:MAG: RNA-binding S4 domain-containing protein [Rhodocyclaceae bacterium]|nr:RNA-binding S4 domain-containing protein [Rhodocyclaceae bacterium]